MSTTKRQIALPDELWRATKVAAAQEGTSATEIVNTALTQWLLRFTDEMPAIPLAPEVIEERTRPPVQEVTEALMATGNVRFGFARPAPKPVKKR